MAELTARERQLVKMLSDPVSWGQAYLRNRDGSPREYWPHQVEDLRCHERNVIHLDGRGVGKSIDLTTQVLHFAFTTRGGQGLIAAPHQGHIDTIIEEVEFQLNANPDLMGSIAVNAQGRAKITRKPYFRLEFTNGAILYFRPAGPYGDAFRSRTSIACGWTRRPGCRRRLGRRCGNASTRADGCASTRRRTACAIPRTIA
jgi:hypothetical protein